MKNKVEPAAPKVVDRDTFQAELDALRVRELSYIHARDVTGLRRQAPGRTPGR